MVFSVSEYIIEIFRGLYSYIIAVIVVLASYIIAHYLSKKITTLKTIIQPAIAINTARIVKLIILTTGVFVALSIIGVDLGGLLIAAGFTGIVVGLAAQQTLSNLFSGLAMIFEGRLKPGDVVRIGSDWGTVESVNVLSTTIRLFSGEALVIPNSVVFNSSIYNFRDLVARRIQLTIGISYNSSIDKAIDIIKKTLWDHPLVLAEPEPFIIVDSLGESSVNLNIFFWVSSKHFLQVRSTILGELKKKLEEAGIEIPFPQRVVWIKQTESTR